MDLEMANLLPFEDPFVARATHVHDVVTIDGWRIKRYEVCVEGSSVQPALLAAALDAARQSLPPIDTPNVFGAGFVIAHQGQHAEWILVDWWIQGGILCQRLFSRPLGSNKPIEAAPAPLTACVWELPVLNHERDAWVQHVLADPANPRLDRYLKASLFTNP